MTTYTLPSGRARVRLGDNVFDLLGYEGRFDDHQAAAEFLDGALFEALTLLAKHNDKEDVKMTTHISNRPPFRVGESHLFVRFANGNTGLVPLGGTLFTAEPGTGHTTCWDGVQDDPNALDQPAVLDHPLTDVINAINGE